MPGVSVVMAVYNAESWLGEAVESVPRSAAEEGHRIVSVEPLGAGEGTFRVVVEKHAAGGGLP